MNAYFTAEWGNFFVAEVGASAALAGLLFVAVSINLGRILSFPGLSGRAGEALLMLFDVLVIATLGLVPGQSSRCYGLEILVLAALSSGFLVFGQVRDARKPGQKASWIVTRVVSGLLGTLPFVGAGLSLVLQTGGGLYWLAPGVLLSFAAALIDAWVLLIEIQR